MQSYFTVPQTSICEKAPKYRHFGRVRIILGWHNGAPSTKACYLGYIAFVIALIVAIATGYAGVSLWMIVFTVLPIFIVLAPLKIIGTLHISAMASTLAWLMVV